MRLCDKLEVHDAEHVEQCQAGQKGVLVREVEPTSAAAGQLQKGDVVLAFDGTKIANDGTIQFRCARMLQLPEANPTAAASSGIQI